MIKKLFIVCIATLLLLILARSVACISTWEHQIFVDGKNGTYNRSCLQGDIPCATFNMALRGALMYDSLVIYISSGSYRLEEGRENKVTNSHQIAIIGNIMSTIIRCDPGTGLWISMSTSVLIESMVFHGCGYRFDFLYDTYYFNAALFIQLSSTVLISNTAIQFSNGTGLFVSQSDNVTVDSCLVTDSKAILPTNCNPSKSYLIGGGIILDGYNSSYYHIKKSTIINNEFEMVWSVLNCWNEAGGGIMVYSIEQTVVIDSCIIANNSRGFAINYQRFSTVLIQNSSIFSNIDNSVVNFNTDYINSSFQLINVSISALSLILSDSSLDVKMNPSEAANHAVGDTEVSILFTQNEATITNHIPMEYEVTIPNCSDIWIRYRGKCSDAYVDEDYTGHCPTAYSNCNYYMCFCDSHHSGRLCGQCIDGYSVAINSPYLSCVSCNKLQHVLEGWTTLIGLEFVPMTVMIFVIVILNVNLNQGSLNAYIFLCQILTIPFPSVNYPSWIVTRYSDFTDRNIYFLPLSMWNLDFITALSYQTQNIIQGNHKPAGLSICISASTSPLGSISFWYTIAYYPLILLMLLYFGIILYDKGHKIVVCVVRPFHRILACFWGIFNIRPSLPHSMASIYTLCFTQLAATSLKILHATWFQDRSGNAILVFFYDGTMDYFHGLHILSMIPAICTLLILILFTLYLAVSPFKWFQRCFNKVNFKKDFLISMTDVFTAPYKNGTESTWDYRCFAGVHSGLKLIIMTFYFIPQDNQNLSIIPILEIITCSLYICTIIIFRPYKRTVHTYSEMVIFFILGVFSCIIFFNSERLGEASFAGTFWYKRLFLPVIGAVIALIITPYCLSRVVRKCKHGHRYIVSFNKDSKNMYLTRQLTAAAHQTSDNHGEFADRLTNPEVYERLEEES